MKKVLFMHPAVHGIGQMLDYLHVKNSKIADHLQWDKNDPDIVFVSELIFIIPKFFAKFKDLYKTGEKRVFVFHGGESIYPDLNIFDYGLVYCTYLKEFNRVIKTPEQQFFFHEKADFINRYSIEAALDSLADREFCSFIYSNAFAHPNRDIFFHMLSQYKTVSSLGAHLNNTGTAPTRGNSNWLEESILTKSKYKFSVAFENETYYGYTTEKLLTSFKAHTVPIYWGNPKVNDYYNPEAFINCHDFENFEQVVERVEEIDRNDELWASILSKPWQTEKQKKRTQEDVEAYDRFLDRLLNADDLSEFIRRPRGTWTDQYYRWFFRAFHTDYFTKVRRRIMHFLVERQR